MKVVLITSSVTYVPENYQNVLNAVLERCEDSIAGVVIVCTPFRTQARAVCTMLITGSFRLAAQFVRNSMHDILHRNRYASAGCDTIRTKSVNTKEVRDWLLQHKVDVMVNMRTRNLFSSETVGVARLGCINVHHGLLPKQRGLFSDIRAIAENSDTGFSLHGMTNTIDDGPILEVKKVPYTSKNYLEYLAAVARAESEAIVTLLHTVSKRNSLPEGVTNTATDSTYTSDPTYAEIRSFKRAGVIM